MVALLLFILLAETPFMLFTIPKSGTHLAVKMLKKLTGASQEWVGPGKAEFPSTYPKNRFNFMHFSDQFELKMYKKLFPGVVPILELRDPRDVCVSSVFYFKKLLDQFCGPDADFNERLSYTIQCQERTLNFCPLFFFKGALEMIEMINPVILRFEDLIGPQGGGSLEMQLNTLDLVASRLKISLSKDRALEIADQLFGDSVTFREGQIGSWKTHFTEEHKAQFKASGLEYYLILFGYENNDNW